MFEKLKLSEIGEVVAGGTPKTKINEYWNGNIPWITPKDLSGYNSIFIRRGERNISKEGFENSSANLLPKGTVLFTSRAPIGYIAIADVEVTTNQGFKSIIVNENNNNLFVYYLLKHNVKYIENLASGSTFKEVSGSVMKNIEFNVPSLSEQKAIAHILSTLDEKIEVNNQINKTLEKMAQAIFKQWFVDFEFPNEASDPYQSCGGEMVESELGLVPKGWEVGSFTDYIDVLSGGTPKTKNKDYWDGDIPFFTPKDTNGTFCIDTEKYLTENGLNSCNSKLYDENTVFITARGTVGKTAIAGVKMAMNQSCYALIGKDDLNQFYVWFQIKSVVEKLQQSATGSVFDAIIIDTFKAIKIIKPDTASIEKFRLIVEPIFHSIQSKYFENKKLKNVRDTLLPKLMSGEIRVLVSIKNKIT